MADKKIKFLLPANAWHEHSAEYLWAKPLKNGRFEILNSPFFVEGISCGDVVTATRSADGTQEFSEVVRHAGGSTYRIIPQAEHAMKSVEWQEIENLGCNFEQGDLGFEIYSVHVPPETDVFKVYSLLERAEVKAIWDFEEGHCGHLTL